MEASSYTVNFLEAMGLDLETFTWHDLALCNGLKEPELFFDRYEGDSNVAKQVDDMCLHCPVMKQCAQAGMEQKEQGVWGGIYWWNGEPDPARNQHKTPEVWEEIRARMTE